ncbi:hypothetical protein BDY24DRAFT_373696 [Mrakia frigida]|uniref:uncharacterized protein n=1 Tax=Mrakia frigida TaxID=29902 RepID=UPI003FCC1BDB
MEEQGCLVGGQSCSERARCSFPPPSLPSPPSPYPTPHKLQLTQLHLSISSVFEDGRSYSSTISRISSSDGRRVSVSSFKVSSSAFERCVSRRREEEGVWRREGGGGSEHPSIPDRNTTGSLSRIRGARRLSRIVVERGGTSSDKLRELLS